LSRCFACDDDVHRDLLNGVGRRPEKYLS
jgi:hypothetical protein